jgi:hypothetical protein
VHPLTSHVCAVAFDVGLGLGLGLSTLDLGKPQLQPSISQVDFVAFFAGSGLLIFDLGRPQLQPSTSHVAPVPPTVDLS